MQDLRFRTCVHVTALLAFCALAPEWAAAGGPAQNEPAEAGVRERVQVRLVQIEVTVHPPEGADPDACLGLTEDDFEVRVNRSPRPVTAVDWLGSAEVQQLIEEAPVPDRKNPPLTMVLFFDLWHLNLFYRDFTCPMTQPLAFEQARELVRTEFRPGDRLLLVTFAGWPQIHGGWIRDRVEALHALDRLEVSPFVVSARRQHLGHLEWINGVESLLLALGRYPGRKEVFYLGDDFRFDDVAMRVYDLAARAQANRVSIHAVDLLASCRSLPGPGCPGLAAGGLGCTAFATPIALGYMSANTGGELIRGGHSLAHAVKTVRRMRRCRYLISFPRETGDGKRAPQATVRLNRKGFRLDAPGSFGDPEREPAEREKQNALFLLPRFARGIEAEVGLWPLRPSGKKRRWRGVLAARIRRTPGDSWPEGLQRIEVEVGSAFRSRIYRDGLSRKVIEGEDLRRLREGRPRSFVLPLEGIRPGLNSVWLRALGVGGDVEANVRAFLDVPRPPGPGETGPWILVDRLARLGGTPTVMPALSGLLPVGKSALLLAYGCRGPDRAFEDGKLARIGSGETVSVPIEWLERGETDDPSSGRCGWLEGAVDPTLSPGLWRFESPASSRKTAGGSYGVEFRVTAGGETAEGW